MLAYHPALDPYHSTYRILRILLFDTSQSYHLDKLRLLDFYLCFPHFLGDARLPPGLRSWKLRFRQMNRKYYASASPALLFKQLESLQRAAVTLLVSNTIIDYEQYSADTISLSAPLKTTIGDGTSRQPRITVIESINTRNESDSEFMDFLINTFGAIDLYGDNGLKARTALMDYRYDPV